MAAWRSPHDTQSKFHLGKRSALLGAIALSLLAFLVQLVGAWYTGSIALFGDSAHLLTDLFSLVMSLAAVILACRPATQGRSFGFYRLEVLATFVNGLLLLVVGLGLIEESVERLFKPSEVKILPLIVVASIGLLFNLISAWLLYRASKASGEDLHAHHNHGHSHDHDHAHSMVKTQTTCNHDHGNEEAHLHEDRNLQAALLHVWSDALGSLAVIVGGVVMQFTNWFWVDAAIGVLLSVWIIKWSWRVILDSGHVLLESTPRHVKPDALVQELRSLDPRVAGVEDLHVWELTSRMYAATAEVRVGGAMSLAESEQLRVRMHDRLKDKFGIAHVVLAIRPISS
jgi:cobalt-zinc-cadmium efflux system protein